MAQHGGACVEEDSGELQEGTRAWAADASVVRGGPTSACPVMLVCMITLDLLYPTDLSAE